MNRFYDEGRKRDLNSLEEEYLRDGFVFTVIYGRRRVGKTSLINEFVRRGNKKAVRFIASENVETVNRGNFSQAVFAAYPEHSHMVAFQTWESAMRYVVKEAAGERAIVVMDEYPYLAKAHPPISSELQICIDGFLQDSNVFLILCGSSMSFMENQVLGYQSPLYGRRTSQHKIGPLDYYSSAEFFAGATYEDKLLGYAATGGIPHYLNAISAHGSVRDGIDKAFFSTSGLLYEEPYNLLKQELREPALYNSILTAVANGATRLNEISGKTRQPDSAIGKYIRNLIEMGILEKSSPIFSDSDRNGIYRIKDGMYRFWYRFIPDTVGLIEGGCEHVFLDTEEAKISDFMGSAFEDVCKQYLTRLNVRGGLPFVFSKIGGWWGGNPKTKKETEIDIVAASKDNAILGECKWTNKKTDGGIYAELREKASAVPNLADRDVCYYLFSRSGFTESLRKEADGNEKLRLVDLKDLFAL